MRVGHRIGLAAVALLLACGINGTAFATPAYNGLYVFGDSLSDAGNVYASTNQNEPVSPPYSNGRFTNGKVWVQDLAGSLGLGPVTPSLGGGNDFAYGGAQTGTTLAHAGNSTDLTSQLTQFNSQVSTPQPDALYTLWIGSNDIDALATGLLGNSLSPADVSTDINQAVAHVGDVVSGLAASGMKNLLALNVPDLSKTPLARAGASLTADPATALSQIKALSSQFDSALEQKLSALAQTDGFDLSLVDTFSAIDQIVANAQAYGLSDVTNPCWTGNFTNARLGTVCSNPDEHLFWDSLHPTAAGHRLVAAAALDALGTGAGAAEPVPEPDSAGMLVLGMLGILLLVGARRRRLDIDSGR